MPNRIGKYEITAEIGRGGFSRVYRGFDPNVNRPVAIKVSTRESDPEHLSRFRNEASAAGNLRHENIVTIHDYGDDDGVPYLVMELLDGRDLHHIMRDGPKLSTLEKMQVMSQVAEGLNCAHLNGVVHRDIKPANVMMLPDGSVKILDFGIARMTGEVSRLTQSGYLVGTPLYMSPEQLQGAEADALGDVWAFGVLYFELLTGQHPFLSQDTTRLIRNITIVNPPSVHSLTRGVPDGLAQVIRRALTKDRRRRYQSLEEVLVDTNPILALLQREQTAGLVTEAQFYRNSGQLIAARRTSRRALEIDPGNYGAQQLLKSIQHEMHEEDLAEPQLTPMPAAPVPPAAQVMVERRFEPIAPPRKPVAPPLAPPLSPPLSPMVRREPQTIAPEPEPQVAAAIAPSPLVAETPIPQPVAAATEAPVISAPVSLAPSPAVSLSAAAAAPGMAYSSTAVETPSPTTQRPRPAIASGAAAAIAAAVAAAKARQAEDDRQQKELETEERGSRSASPAFTDERGSRSASPAFTDERGSRSALPAVTDERGSRSASPAFTEEATAPPIKSTPLVVSALPSRMAPPTGTFKRPENASGLFVTEDPLVVKRPADAVMTQRMSAGESSAAVATPSPASPPAPPPTRLPGTKAIPPSLPRSTNGTAEAKSAAPPTAPTDRRGSSENLPMRRPPTEVYAKGRRRSSNSLFADNAKQSKSFPWAVVGVLFALATVAVALVLFSWSSPMRASAPVLTPEKMLFVWKPMTAFPPDQLLTLKAGAANAAYIASSDEDWLVITPAGDESNNRQWHVKVEPDKLGQMVPGVNTGWVDVTSAEGIKTTAEVTLKIGPGEAAPPVVKRKKTQPLPAITSVPPAAKNPLPATGNITDSAKTVGKTATKKPEPPAKKPASDGVDLN